MIVLFLLPHAPPPSGIGLQNEPPPLEKSLNSVLSLSLGLPFSHFKGSAIVTLVTLKLIFVRVELKYCLVVVVTIPPPTPDVPSSVIQRIRGNVAGLSGSQSEERKGHHVCLVAGVGGGGGYSVILIQSYNLLSEFLYFSQSL